MASSDEFCKKIISGILLHRALAHSLKTRMGRGSIFFRLKSGETNLSRYAQASPSLSQAQRLKKLSQEGGCTLDAMCEVMNEIKKDELDHVTIKNEVLRKYFPKSYTPKQMQDTIIRLLEKWQRSKQRDMER